MRGLAAAAAVVLTLLALPGAADVRLIIRSDGTKVISNDGFDRSKRATDYNWLARQRNRRSEYDELIDRFSTKFNVDPVLVRAVILIESNFNPSCVSRKGARGLMQLMPGTARQYGVKSIHDPEENIRGGVRYLADLLDMFRDLPRALAAYNAGQNAVLKYGGIPPFEETDVYVKRALTVYYGRPYGQAVSFPGRSGGPRLNGGFKPVAVASLPGMRYLGSQ